MTAGKPRTYYHPNAVDRDVTQVGVHEWTDRDGERFIIILLGGGHSMWTTDPARCRELAAAFTEAAELLEPAPAPAAGGLGCGADPGPTPAEQARSAKLREAHAQAVVQAADIPQGEAGECLTCGAVSGLEPVAVLVDGVVRVQLYCADGDACYVRQVHAAKADRVQAAADMLDAAFGQRPGGTSA